MGKLRYWEEDIKGMGERGLNIPTGVYTVGKEHTKLECVWENLTSSLGDSTRDMLMRQNGTVEKHQI